VPARKRQRKLDEDDRQERQASQLNDGEQEGWSRWRRSEIDAADQDRNSVQQREPEKLVDRRLCYPRREDERGHRPKGQSADERDRQIGHIVSTRKCYQPLRFAIWYDPHTVTGRPAFGYKPQLLGVGGEEALDVDRVREMVAIQFGRQRREASLVKETPQRRG